MKTELKQQFDAACEALRAAGYSVIAVVGRHGPDEAEFVTCVAPVPHPSSGVTENHVVLDAIREIAGEWSRRTHHKEA